MKFVQFILSLSLLASVAVAAPTHTEEPATSPLPTEVTKPAVVKPVVKPQLPDLRDVCDLGREVLDVKKPAEKK